MCGSLGAKNAHRSDSNTSMLLIVPIQGAWLALPPANYTREYLGLRSELIQFWRGTRVPSGTGSVKAKRRTTKFSLRVVPIYLNFLRQKFVLLIFKDSFCKVCRDLVILPRVLTGRMCSSTNITSWSRALKIPEVSLLTHGPPHQPGLVRVCA